MPRRRPPKLPLFNVTNESVLYCARNIIEDRASEHETTCTALLPQAQASLLPLVHGKDDIVKLVTKNYQWSLLMDKVCELEQQYEQMISKAEDTLSANIKTRNEYDAEEDMYWSMRNDKDMYGFDIMSGTMWERDALRSESGCRHLCHNIAVELYVLKQDVAKCQKFEHPDPARSVRKTEGAKMAHRLKKLLLSIDKSLKLWLHNYARFH
jgi:hypothetical protein